MPSFRIRTGRPEPPPAETRSVRPASDVSPPRRSALGSDRPPAPRTIVYAQLPRTPVRKVGRLAQSHGKSPAKSVRPQAPAAQPARRMSPSLRIAPPHGIRPTDSASPRPSGSFASARRPRRKRSPPRIAPPQLPAIRIPYFVSAVSARQNANGFASAPDFSYFCLRDRMLRPAGPVRRRRRRTIPEEPARRHTRQAGHATHTTAIPVPR